MIKTISNIQIDSIIYEKSANDNSSEIKNKLFISTSLDSSVPKSQTGKTRLRLVLSLNPEVVKTLDYVSQRYNEYLSVPKPSLSTYDFNKVVQRTLESAGTRMKSSSPFFPMSTDIGSIELLFQNGVSSYGDGNIITKDVLIYDIPLDAALNSENPGRQNLSPISIELPETSEAIKDLSLYMFVYDTRVPNLSRKNPVDNFSLTTGATPITRVTPLGTRTIYDPISSTNMSVGMSEASTSSQPNNKVLSVVDTYPQENVVVRYSNVFNKVSDIFSNTSPSRNYNLSASIKKSNYFSDLWLSRGMDDSHKFVFAFDLRNYLIDHAIFPFVFRSDRLSRAAIQGASEFSTEQLSRVLSMDVYRQSLEPDAYIVNNSMTTVRSKAKLPDSVWPYVTVENIKKVDIMVPRYNNLATDFYEGHDSGNTNSSGPHAYSINCTVYDNSPLILRSISSVVTGYKNTIRQVIDSLSYLIDDFDDLSKATVAINNSTNTVGDVVMRIVEDYESILNAINPSMSSVELGSYYKGIIRGSQGLSLSDLEEVEKILNLGVHFLYQQLERVFPNDPLGRLGISHSPSFRENLSRSVKNSISTLSHSYPNRFEIGKNNNYGLDYIFSKDTSENLNSISADEYAVRRQDEFRKYFISQNSDKLSVPLGSYSDPSFAYLSPKIFNLPGRPLFDQSSVDVHNGAVEYDYNQYSDLFNNIVQLNYKIDKIGMMSPSIPGKASEQSLSNKTYSSIIEGLSNQLSTSITETVTPQFSSPRVEKGQTKTTVYDPRSKDSCGLDSGLDLITSVIGGQNTSDDETKAYINNVDQTFSSDASGSADQKSANNNRKKRALRLPFLIYGELAVGDTLSMAKEGVESTFNSLALLRKTLKITNKNAAQRIEESPLESLPNQLKNMILISSMADTATLSSGEGSVQYEACRPVVLDGIKGTESSDLVSVFTNEQNIPPYPQVEDPMKSYAKFLAFWMNYRNLAVVEYLDNFDSIKPLPGNFEQPSRLKLDVWSKLTPLIVADATSAGRSMLCRVRLMEAVDYLDLFGDDITEQQKRILERFFETKEEINLPPYNKYFYIN